METSHSEREAQRSGWESLSPTLHYVFMGSLSKALYAFTPPPPFSVSRYLRGILSTHNQITQALCLQFSLEE